MGEVGLGVCVVAAGRRDLLLGEAQREILFYTILWCVAVCRYLLLGEEQRALLVFDVEPIGPVLRPSERETERRELRREGGAQREELRGRSSEGGAQWEHSVGTLSGNAQWG